MKVKTQLAQLKANCGNITDEEISEWTGIEPQELQDLENGSAQEIKFSTLGKLCSFFQCTPNDLLILDMESQINETSLSPEAITKAREIIKQGLRLAEATPQKSAQEIWGDFQAIRGEITAELMELEHQSLMEK